MCLFSNVYIHSPSFMKNNFWENILCIHLSQRERKKHKVVCKARTWRASSWWCRSFYLRKQTFVSLKTSQIVWVMKFVLRRLCQTQDLICIIHSSCIWSVSFNYITDFFLYIPYLFIIFVYHILFVLLLIIRSVCCSLLLNHKVNCWNIFNSYID